MNNVSIINTNSYEQSEVTTSIRKHFELHNIAAKLNTTMTVLIKPNLLMKRKPEEATTTHPNIIAGVIECLQEIGIDKIIIADSPGGLYTKQALAGIYSASQMDRVAKKYNVRLNQDYTHFKKRVENGVKVHEFTLISPVNEADFIINVAKLKTHTMTTLSGAVKNLFGTVPGLMKPEFHFTFPDKYDFTNMLIDLCETVKPNLCIIDAVVSMEGDGPSGGSPRETKLTLASENPYDLDVVLCELIGANVNKVPTVKNAIKRSLSVDSIKKINLIGDEFVPIKDFQMPTAKQLDFVNNIPKCLRKIAKPISEKLLASKPIIKKSKCIGCGKCAESCPANTIKIVDKKAIIRYDNCIKCFCCHEMCPPKAIEIKRFKLFKH